MKNRLQITSIILLVMLGFNFFVQAVTYHVELAIPTEISEDMNLQQDEFHSTTNCPIEQHSENTKNCTDPCHTGRCHFGHCHHFVKSYSLSQLLWFTQIHSNCELSTPKSPTLESPKRPPRHV